MSEPAPLDLMQYLPALFRAQHVETELGSAFRRDEVEARADRRSDPLRAIVQVYEKTAVERVEQILSDLPQPFQADKATYTPGWPIADFLSMLARWVALDPDGIAMYGQRGEAWAERKLRFLVKNAAVVHAAHGTPHGLRYILEVLCDADLEVLEWTWPQGFEVGLSSSIGIDTFLTDQPDAAHCLTVIWKTELPTSEEPDVLWLKTPCQSRLGERRILNRIVTAPEGRAASALDKRLMRMKHLLTTESPAHTASYLALEPAEERPSAEAAVFVVEVTSTVGAVWIETAG
jgi:P2-related tail formation protein